MLRLTRIWLPATIAVAGIAAHRRSCPSVARRYSAGAGVVLLGVALIVWMINWLFRMSIESNRDREREEEARRYFDEHGRWPDEG